MIRKILGTVAMTAVLVGTTTPLVLATGKSADLVVWRVPSSTQIPYWPAADLARAVVKRGRVVLHRAHVRGTGAAHEEVELHVHEPGQERGAGQRGDDLAAGAELRVQRARRANCRRDRAASRCLVQ